MIASRKLGRGICALLVLWIGACAETEAPVVETQPEFDLLLTNARIYTVDAERPWAHSLGVRDGRIAWLGAEGESGGTAVRTLDLGGGFVMPGIIDGHAHPAWGGVVESFYCRFSATALPAEIRQTIADCVAESPDSELWIQGGLWAADFFTQYQIDSPRLWLDEVSAGRAIALRDDSGHNYVVNSAGLDLLGIDEGTPPPEGASFGRDSNDRLNGVLYEAFGLLGERLPPWTVEHYREGIRFAVANALGHGVTGWKDASTSLPETQAYFQADVEGELPVNVGTSLYLAEEEGWSQKVDRYARMRDVYRSTRVHTDFVKIFLDGIPTTARTAAMIEPYVHEEDEPASTGALHVAEAELAQALVALDAAGFTVKIHTAGDRSVRVALDAVEAARQANGESGLRHELAHAGFVAASDIPRFASLNAVADLSPHLWFPSPIVQSVRTALGERGHEYWPNRDLHDSGAQMLVGSDWPSVAPDMNPWIGMEALVTREAPVDEFPGAGWKSQSLTLAEAIDIMTLGGARALRIEDRTGSLQVGKSADFILLDRDLLEIPVDEIADVRVLATYFEGRRVYEAQ